jgi:hypothetical protein
VTPLYALAVVPLALVAGTLLLLLARARAFRRPVTPAPPDDAISPEEGARLEQWELRLRVAIALVITTYLVALMVALSDDLRSLIGPRAALVTLGLACLVGAAAQFSTRCPRCRFNLGFQSRLALPERCERCGVPYHVAQFGDGSPNPETPASAPVARNDDDARPTDFPPDPSA